MTVDVLAVGAHPDDVELGVGGTLHRLIRDGYSVAILDLTRGEMGTRGDAETREQEARDAAHILGIEARLNAGLPDGALENTLDQRHRVIPFIRELRPTVILAPMANDRHPDHAEAQRILRDANFLAGLTRIDTDQEPHRAARLYFYPSHEGKGAPALVMDITDAFDVKLAAIRAYQSQFDTEYTDQQTYISTPEYWESITAKARYWGATAGFPYGEPLFAEGPVGVSTLPGLEMKL